MDNKPCLHANFIPLPRSTALAEIYALKARYQSRQDQMDKEESKARTKLALKLRVLKKRVIERAKQQTAQQQSAALNKSEQEAKIKSQNIINNCYRDSLNTIKNVCLSVFAKSPDCCNQLLQERLKIAFENLAGSEVTSLESSAFFSPDLPDFQNCSVFKNPNLPEGQARIRTKSGDIMIDVIADLSLAFDKLEEKLNQKLCMRDPV